MRHRFRVVNHAGTACIGRIHTLKLPASNSAIFKPLRVGELRKRSANFTAMRTIGEDNGAIVAIQVNIGEAE